MRNLFKIERGISGVFNTFVNQSCVKKDKNVFQLAFRSHALPEILKTYGKSRK